MKLSTVLQQRAYLIAIITLTSLLPIYWPYPTSWCKWKFVVASKAHITLTRRAAYLLLVPGAWLKIAMKACACSEGHSQHSSTSLRIFDCKIHVQKVLIFYSYMCSSFEPFRWLKLKSLENFLTWERAQEKFSLMKIWTYETRRSWSIKSSNNDATSWMPTRNMPIPVNGSGFTLMVKKTQPLFSDVLRISRPNACNGIISRCPSWSNDIW